MKAVQQGLEADPQEVTRFYGTGCQLVLFENIKMIRSVGRSGRRAQGTDEVTDLAGNVV